MSSFYAPYRRGLSDLSGIRLQSTLWIPVNAFRLSIVPIVVAIVGRLERERCVAI